MDNLNQTQPQQSRVAVLQQSAPMVDAASLPFGLNSSSTNFMPQQQISDNHTAQEEERLRSFWENEMHTISHTIDFKNHSLPFARVKKIMKTDPEVKKISARTPIILAKACELFISELTFRSWAYAEKHKRRTLNKYDIATAITRTEIYDFLEYIVSKDEGDFPLVESRTNNVAHVPPPYYYMPHQSNMGVVTGQAGNQAAAAATYVGQQVPLQFRGPWPRPQTDMNPGPSGSS